MTFPKHFKARRVPSLLRQAGFIRLSMLLSRWGSKSFSVRDLFRSGEQGAWYETYDPNTLLVRRNLLTWSEQLGNAAWTTNGNVQTVDAATAPDGTATADKLNEATLTGFFYVLQNQSYVAGQTYTLSAYFKSAERGFALLGENSNAAGRRTSFNLSTGAVAAVNGAHTAGIEPASLTFPGAPAGWYRCWITFVATTTVSSWFSVNVTDGGVASYAGTAGNGVYAWGVQFDKGALTPYQRVTDWNTEYLAAVSSSITLYQDSAGTTPVTAVGQPVGMVLDKRLGLVRGAELVTNGTFDAAMTGWTDNPGNVVSASIGGEARLTSSAAGACTTSTPITTVVGKTYEVTGTVRNGTSASGALLTAMATQFGSTIAGSPAVLATVNTPSRVVFVASGATTYIGTRIASAAGAGETAFFDNISVRELPGNHSTQATAASRPTLSAKYNKTTVNNYSPSGTTGLSGSAISGGLVSAVAVGSLPANIQTALNASAAAGLVTAVYKIDNSGGGAAVDCTFATTGTTDKHVVSAFGMASAGSGTLRVSGGAGVAFSSASFSRISEGNITPSSSGASAFVRCDAASVVYFILHDLRLDADAALAIPAYQRVNTATDYDTAGFFFRDDFDGVDDSRTSATGGGSTTGFFYCAAIKVNGGAGTIRSLWSDRGTNTGYQVRINTANQLEFIGGNGTTYNGLSTSATLPVGETHVVTAWDDGINFYAQVDKGQILSALRPAVVAGTAGFSEGTMNSSQYLFGGIYSRVYRAGPPPDAATIARLQKFIGRKAGLSL